MKISIVGSLRENALSWTREQHFSAMRKRKDEIGMEGKRRGKKKR